MSPEVSPGTLQFVPAPEGPLCHCTAQKSPGLHSNKKTLIGAVFSRLQWHFTVLCAEIVSLSKQFSWVLGVCTPHSQWSPPLAGNTDQSLGKTLTPAQFLKLPLRAVLGWFLQVQFLLRVVQTVLWLWPGCKQTLHWCQAKGDLLAALQLHMPGSHISPSSKPSAQAPQTSPGQRAGTRGCWRDSGFRQQGKHPLSEQTENRMSSVPWIESLVQSPLQGPNYPRELSRIWAFPPWSSWVFSMSSEGWLFYFKAAVEVPVAGV